MAVEKAVENFRRLKASIESQTVSKRTSARLKIHD